MNKVLDFRNNWLRLVVAALYTLFILGFYHLVIIPLALDLSFIGLLMGALFVIIGYFAVPRHLRRYMILFSLSILLFSYGVNSIYSTSIALRIIEFPLMYGVIGYLSYLYGKVKWQMNFVVLLVLAVFQSFIPISSLPYYSHFQLKYISPQTDNLALFPVYPVVNQGSNLYTLGSLPLTKTEAVAEANQHAADIKLTPLERADKLILQLQNVNVLRFAQQQGMLESGVTETQMKQLPFLNFGLTGFPYYVSSWSTVSGHVQQHFQAVDPPVDVLTSFLNPLSTTLSMNQRAERSSVQSRQNWTKSIGTNALAQVAGSTLIGKGRFTPDTGEQFLLEGNNEIQLVNAQNPDSVLATYKGTFQDPLSDDVLIGDVTGDGIDEVLLNTSPARILKLDPATHSWNVLWTSAKPSFRFEFLDRNGAASSTVIANDPSFVRDQPARYLSAYTWKNGQLIRDWRVFKVNMLFPFQLPNHDWVVQLYGQHQFVLLSPLTLFLPFWEVILYLVLLVGGFAIQFRQKGVRQHA